MKYTYFVVFKTDGGFHNDKITIEIQNPDNIESVIGSISSILKTDWTPFSPVLINFWKL